METQFILTVFFVNYAMSFVQLHHQTPYEAHLSHAEDENGIRENLLNLMDSVAREDTRKGDTYRQVLKHEVANENRDFDAIKEDFRSIRYRNDYRKDSHDRIEAGQKMMVVKRETPASSSYETTCAADDTLNNVNPDTFHREIMQRTIELMWAQQAHLIQMKIRESSIRRKSKQSAPDMQDLITDTDALFQREMDTLSDRFWTPKAGERHANPMISEVYKHFMYNWKKFEELVEKDFKNRANVETDCEEIKEEMRKAQTGLTAGYEEIKGQMKKLEQIRISAKQTKKQTA